jgi:hypothetical protein
MATVGLATGTMLLLLIVDSWSQTPPREPKADPGKSRPPAAGKHAEDEAKPSESHESPVELQLMIAGLGSSGCDVEIKPGSRSCRFKPQHQHVNTQGRGRFLIKDVELRGADRNCIFAITLKEPGEASRTIYRGFRMTTSPSAGTQAFTCYTNSPSRLARLEKPESTVR